MRPQSMLRLAAVPAAAGAFLLPATEVASAQVPAPAVQAAVPARKASVITARTTKLEVLRGSRAVVTGTLRPARAGRKVLLEREDGRRWRRLAADKTDAAGRYKLVVRPKSTGSARVRVRFAGDGLTRRTQRKLGRLSVYRPSLASRYDLYGGPLACGGTLGYDSMVVAHKSLPCGTKVTVRYRGRSVQATVRDRGPYVGGREFDLAGAVARKLGFDGVGTIWVTK